MPSPLSKVLRDGSDRIRKAFTAGIAEHGFVRGKNSIWHRCHEHTADVVILHRGGGPEGEPSSACVRTKVDLAIRVLDDPSDVLTLNGPSSDREGVQADGYHLEFDAHSNDEFDRGRDDLLRFVLEQGESFFGKFPDAAALRDAADSPLDPETREWLRAGIAGEPNLKNRKNSRQLLGIKKPK